MIGEVHRRAAVLAGATVVGVMASSPERSRAGGGRSGGSSRRTPNLDEVVASDAEIVHICTPNASHVPYAVALLEAGKHVLCEKPLGVGLADAEQAYAVAERDRRWSTPSRSPTASTRWPGRCGPGCRTRRASARST